MSPDVTKFELFPPDCLNKPVTFDPSWSDWLKRVSFCLFLRTPAHRRPPGVGDGQGSLACCDSWGCKESDTTERLN